MSHLFYRNLRRTYPVVKSAQGVWVEDAAGNRYLDACSGAVACNLGHGIKRINDAITEQLSRVAFAHTSQFVSEPALALAERLIDLAPPSFRGDGHPRSDDDGGLVYFVSGGSEAVETAIKMARGYFVERGELTRHLVISRWNSYHGSTLGALSVTGHPARRKPYLSMLKDQPHIGAAYPYRCSCSIADGSCNSEVCAAAGADQLESMILKLGAENIIGFIAEPIVGAALGAAAPQDGYWQRIRRICTKYDILLIADEVMTGLGRCGAAFALDLWGVAADIVAVGKGLAAGYMPLGAVLASARVAQAYREGTGVFEHGYTYSGHPASCAAGLAAVSILKEERLISAVSAREGEFFTGLNRLKQFDFVGDVRGRGFLAGIEFVSHRQTKEPFDPSLGIGQAVAKAAMQQGLMVYPGAGFVDGMKGDHIMIAPPLNISSEEMNELVQHLERTLAQVSSAQSSRI
jgi:adenosylmethionine-8-amino-7-oxononanoate aminotransferase